MLLPVLQSMHLRFHVDGDFFLNGRRKNSISKNTLVRVDMASVTHTVQTSTCTHTRGDMNRNLLSELPHEFIDKLVLQLKSYMTFLSSPEEPSLAVSGRHEERRQRSRCPRLASSAMQLRTLPSSPRQRLSSSTLNQVQVQVELYCHSATCGDMQWNEMSCLTGPRCYINTDIQQ